MTARFDTSTAFRHRDTVTGSGPQPVAWPGPTAAQRRRCARPAGEHAHGPGQPADDPPAARARRLEQARACPLEFGRFHGATLGEVADREPTYIDWIARTITRDRDLVLSARVIAADLDARGIEREVRPPKPGFGTAGPEREAAETSAW